MQIANEEAQNSLMDIDEKQRPIENSVPQMECGEGMQNACMNAGKWKQVLATVIASMSTLAVEAMVMSTVHPNDTDRGFISPKMYTFAAIIVGLLISYLLCEYFGRKITLCCTGIIFIICCALTAYGSNPTCDIVIFYLAQSSSSMLIFALPIYVSEISHDSIRGTLGGIRMIFVTVGIAIAHLLDRYSDKQTTASAVIFFPVILVIGMVWMPESPVFLVKKPLLGNATRSLRWLRNNDEECVQSELLRIEQTVQTMPNSSSCICKKVIVGVNGLFATPAKRQTCLITFALIAAYSAAEMHLLESWYRRRNISSLLSIGKTILPPILGSVLATLLMDSVGRRRLLLTSCTGTAFFCVIAAIVSFFSLSFEDVAEWIFEALSFACGTSYYLGMGTVPIIIAVEVFQRDVLSLGYMISLSIFWIVRFTYVSMPYISWGSNVDPLITRICFYICVCCFTFFFVPETKGKAIK